MNPQAFRQKLDHAVIEQDQQQLAELGRIASENPLTAQIWQKHLQVEQAIQIWTHTPAIQSPARSAKLAAPATKIRRTSLRRLQPFLAMLLLCAVAVGFYRNLPTDPTLELAELPSPVKPTTPVPLELTEIVDEPSPLIDVSLALVSQGRELLDPNLIPLLPHVTMQLEESMKGTWETLSSLPVGMQQAWQGMGLEAEDLNSEIPAETELLQPDEVNPAGRSPRKFRRLRPNKSPALEADRNDLMLSTLV